MLATRNSQLADFCESIDTRREALSWTFTQISALLAIQLIAFLSTAAGAAPLGSFHYSYKDVFDTGAETYVVSQSNVQRVDEGNVHYYSPISAGTPASLTYRFDLGSVITDASLFAHLASYNFGGDSFGFGSLWGSTDGSSWHLLMDAPTPAPLGQGYFYNQSLPASLLGDTDVWFQIRMQASGWSIFSQFSRTDKCCPIEIFRFDALMVPDPTPDPPTSVILNFGQNSSSNTVTAVNDGASPLATTTISGTDVGITIAGNNLGLAPGAQAYLTFSATSTGPSSVAANGDFVQPYAGAFSIRSAVGGGGVNYLSGSFSDSVFGDGASLTLQASQPADAVGFTSDIPGAPIYGPRGLSWSLANLLPLASQSNNSLASFTASIAGNFTGAVPEPGTLACAALLSLALASRRSRGGRNKCQPISQRTPCS